MKKFELYILIICIFACGLVTTSQTKDVSMPIRYVIWSVLTGVLLFSIFSRKADFGFLGSPVVLCFALYLLVMILSISYAYNKSEAVYQVLKTFLWLAFLVVTVVIVRGHESTLLKSMIVLGLIFGCYGIYQFFRRENGFAMPTDLEGFYLQVGTMSGRNLWSAAQFLMLPFCVFGLTFGKIWKVLSIVTILSLLFNILILQGRSVWLGLAVSAFSVLVLRPRILAFALLGSVVVAGCIYLSNTGYARTLVKRMTDSKSPTERMQLWSASWDMYKDKVVGAGNWPLMIQPYGHNVAPPDGGRAWQREHYRHPHNDFVTALCETNIFGLNFLVSIFVTALYLMYRKRTKICLMVIAGVVGYGVFAFFSFPSERAFHPMILMVYLGLGLAQISYKEILVKFPVAMIVILVMAFAVLDFWHRYDAQRMFVLADRAKLRALVDGKWNEVLKVMQGYPTWFSKIGPFRTPLYSFKAEATYHLGNRVLAGHFFELAVEDHPNHMLTMNDLAGIYHLQGRTKEAIVMYEKTDRIFPGNVGVKRNLEFVRKNL